MKTGVRRRPRTRFGRFVTVAGLAALVIVVLAGIDLWLVARRIHHVTVNLPASNGGTTWLLVGSDSRLALPSGPHAYGTVAQAPGSHADAIVAVHVEKTTVHAISIPRDTLVSPAPGVVSRLTLTLNQGPQQLIDGLCRSLRIPVTHLVIINMRAFADAVDALGGISIESPAAIRDRFTGLNLQHGLDHLDGVQLLALVRSRHAETKSGGKWVEATPSQGAQDRARNVGRAFKALAAKTRSRLANPLQLQQLAWALTGGMTTDDGTGVWALRHLPLGATSVHEIPVRFIGRDALTAVPDAATQSALARAGYTRTCQARG